MMKNSPIAQIVVGLPIEGPFDYAIPASLRPTIAIGQRVSVIFNHRKKVGYVVGFKNKSAFRKLSSVLGVLDKQPALTPQALTLTKMVSECCGSSWGEAIETYLPKQLRNNKPLEDPNPLPAVTLVDRRPDVTLIHDVSRTQSWPLMMDAISQTLAQKRSVIFLVPGAHFIKDVQAQCAKYPEKITSLFLVYDKKPKPQQETDQWLKLRHSPPVVIVGTRSAVFAPLPSLGLIVVYEEENSSYKQEQVPHYHARDVALMRSQIEGADVLVVSAVPSAETWFLAQRKKWKRIGFPVDPSSAVTVVDMRQYNPRRHSILSFPLQTALQKTLEQNGKAILYFNRKGFSRITRCNQCGFTVSCPRCDIPLKYIFTRKKMVCSSCGHETDLPKICPACKGAYLRSMGTGIEKLESEVARLFPQARTGRYERESTTAPSQANVLIATQALLRLEDNWPADLVAVMNFDNELNHADFRSANRALSLLVHFRLWARQKLMIQTTMPDNDCVKTAKTLNFAAFYKRELKARKEVGLPPHTHLVALTLRGPDEQVLNEQSQQLYELLKKDAPSGVDISEPFSEGAPKLRDKYRLIIILKGKKTAGLLALAKKTMKKVRRKKGTVIGLDGNP
ncbi:MAG: primosomal protein N' [Candidatus Omnitrophota bacterium]|nr:primosomal protein N' [Candidatus Omnitrophota bacterium]